MDGGSYMGRDLERDSGEIPIIVSLYIHAHKIHIWFIKGSMDSFSQSVSPFDSSFIQKIYFGSISYVPRDSFME